MRNIPYLIIAILLFIIFCLVQCGGRKEKNITPATSETKTIIHSDTVYIHDTSERKVYIPGSKIFRHDSLYFAYPQYIDTAKILKDYYTEFTYKNEFRDSNLYALIIDTLFRNRITGRGIVYKILRPDKIITNTIEVPKKQPWIRGLLGLESGYMPALPSMGKLTSITPGIIFLSRVDNAYYFGYNTLDRSYHMGAYIKIHFGK